jgi:micrococcal nuclease
MRAKATLALALSAVLVTACAGTNPGTPTVSQVPTTGPTVLVSSLAPTPLLTPATPAITTIPTVSTAADTAYTVTKVVDGDTIDVQAPGGPVQRVRFIGIDAPEADTCAGPLATDDLIEYLNGYTVYLTANPDGDDADRYNRLLRYVNRANDFALPPLDAATDTDAGYHLLLTGHAVARYDSEDGYDAHPRQEAYHQADFNTPDYTC